MRPLLTTLNKRFLQYAILDKRLCVDESMKPYFERHGAEQFLRGKLTRFGYKMWCLCNRLGYLIQCDSYQGACATYDQELGVGFGFGASSRSTIQNLWRSHFSFVKFAKNLKSKGIGYTRTVNQTELRKLH